MPIRLLFTTTLIAALLAAPTVGVADEAASAEARSEVAEPEAAATEGDATATDDQVMADASYALGMSIATNLSRQGVEIQFDRLMAGMRTVLTDAEPEMTPQEAQMAIQAMQQRLQRKAAESAAAMAEEGREFLEENAERDAVTATESGLQYEVLREGEGESPDVNDRVTVHYEGRLINGEVFDSSYQRGEPATFGLGQVIPGWTEGVALMSEGAKYRLYIPSYLAYGEQGSPRGGIGPNQALIFDVELLEVDEQEPTADTGNADG